MSLITTTTTAMADTANERTPRQQPRRSAREKRVSQQFSNMSPTKRKRVEQDTDLSDLDLPHMDLDEDEDEDEYVAPRKFKAPTRGRGRGRGRAGGAPKKPRATKTVPDTPDKPPRRSRKATGALTPGGRGIKEAKIADDNALFNAIMNPAAALQTSVEDFLESFQQSQESALADLMNCVLRCCGSNDSVDADKVVDYDGIVDALDDFTEVLKEDEAPTYPLTSKHPMFKKFRKSLSEFLSRLIAAAAEMETLYTTDLLMTIQAWIVAMSSSQLRSFRHTATVIALEIETALCEVAAAVEKEAEVIMRQKEGEKKRKAGKAGSRDKELEKKGAEIKDKRAKLAEFLKEFFDGVFIHRYRDLDPHIRAECVHAMGAWLKTFPAHFLDGQYLRYIGWVLSDTTTLVRLEAVRSLVALYAKQDYIVSLQSFTTRFKPRLIEMATCDTDLAVRVVVIQVLGAIDSNSLLEDEQRAALCLLIFDTDARVRKAVSNFVQNVWTEATEQRLVGKRNPTAEETKRAGLKALSRLFLQWGRALDSSSPQVEAGDDDSSSEDASLNAHICSSSFRSRIALGIEALYDEIEVVSDWEAMLDLLLLDHSASNETSAGGTPVPSRRKRGKKNKEIEYEVDECWRLEEVEETILLEMLLATLQKAKADAAAGKKSDEENIETDITRSLIKALPSLISRHQTDEQRVHLVLLVAELMNMEMYLEMRMLSSYEALWDDITKQFFTHTSPAVLTACTSLISILLSTTSLSNTNSVKISALEETLSSSLFDAVGGREELEVATFSEDEIGKLGGALARMSALSGCRDLTTWTEEDEGGKQSQVWDIVSALAERGRLGYREEGMMVERATHFLMLHIIWKARHFMNANAVSSLDSPSEEVEALQESVRGQRDVLLEKLVEYALGTQSNTLLEVRRAAFEKLLTLYILFSAPSTSHDQPNQQKSFPLAPLALVMSEETQYRCAGFVQAEVERYAEDLENENPSFGAEGVGDHSGSESDAEDSRKDKGKKDKNSERQPDESKSKLTLQKEFVFSSVVLSFLRAIRVGVLHVRHGSTLLAYYGRLGTSFDSSARLLVEILREEGMYKGNGAVVVDVIVDALKESQTHILDRLVSSSDALLSLSKALTPALLVRGAQLSVIRSLPAHCIISIHTALISWIAKKISAYNSTKKKRGVVDSVGFFKALQNLLVGLGKEDAMVIKAHLEQQMEMLNIQVPSTAKAWESFRAYERRLTTLSTKEKGAHGGRAAKSKLKAGGEATTSGGENEIEAIDDAEVEGLVEVHANLSQPAALSTPVRKAKAGPRPRPAFRKAREAQNQAPGTDEDGVDREESPSLSQTQSSHSRMSSEAGGSEDEENEDDDFSQNKRSKSTATNGLHTPSRSRTSRSTVSPSKSSVRSRKRGRSTLTDDEDGHESSQAPSPVTPRADAGSPSTTQGEEYIVKKKRVRH